MAGLEQNRRLPAKMKDVKLLLKEAKEAPCTVRTHRGKVNINSQRCHKRPTEARFKDLGVDFALCSRHY
jgi:hypothetical protein